MVNLKRWHRDAENRRARIAGRYCLTRTRNEAYVTHREAGKVSVIDAKIVK